MSKLPSLQFYPGDWKRDPGIRSLNFHDRGVWFEILLLMFESDERGVLLLNGKPMPIEALSFALGLDNQILTTTLTTLLTYGVVHRREKDGALYNKRMVRDEEIRQVRIKAGSKGGNPNLLNQNPTTGDNQNPTPSSSSSSSTSTSIKREHRDAILADVNIPAEWEEEAINSLAFWLEYRRLCNKKLPEPSLAALIQTWGKNRKAFIAAVNFSISQGYQGLFEPRAKGVGWKKADAEECRKKAWEILEGKRNEQRTDNPIFEGDNGSIQVFPAN